MSTSYDDDFLFFKAYYILEFKYFHSNKIMMFYDDSIHYGTDRG